MSVPTPDHDSSRNGYPSDFSTPTSSQQGEQSTSAYAQNQSQAGSPYTDSTTGGYPSGNFAPNGYVNDSPYSNFPSGYSSGYPGGYPGGFNHAQPGYQGAYPNPHSAGYGIPAGYRPVYGQPGVFLAPDGTYHSQKSRVVAGILGILLGSLGIHRFYLGHIGIGIVQIVVTMVTLGLGSLWGFVEGILILCSPSTFPSDAEGFPLL